MPRLEWERQIRGHLGAEEFSLLPTGSPRPIGNCSLGTSDGLRVPAGVPRTHASNSNRLLRKPKRKGPERLGLPVLPLRKHFRLNRFAIPRDSLGTSIGTCPLRRPRNVSFSKLEAARLCSPETHGRSSQAIPLSISLNPMHCAKVFWDRADRVPEYPRELCRICRRIPAETQGATAGGLQGCIRAPDRQLRVRRPGAASSRGSRFRGRTQRGAIGLMNTQQLGAHSAHPR